MLVRRRLVDLAILRRHGKARPSERRTLGRRHDPNARTLRRRSVAHRHRSVDLEELGASIDERGKRHFVAVIPDDDRAGTLEPGRTAEIVRADVEHAGSEDAVLVRLHVDRTRRPLRGEAREELKSELRNGLPFRRDDDTADPSPVMRELQHARVSIQAGRDGELRLDALEEVRVRRADQPVHDAIGRADANRESALAADARGRTDPAAPILRLHLERDARAVEGASLGIEHQAGDGDGCRHGRHRGAGRGPGRGFVEPWIRKIFRHGCGSRRLRRTGLGRPRRRRRRGRHDRRLRRRPRLCPLGSLDPTESRHDHQHQRREPQPGKSQPSEPEDPPAIPHVDVLPIETRRPLDESSPSIVDVRARFERKKKHSHGSMIRRWRNERASRSSSSGR